MVFLKPTILNDSDITNQISLEKYNYFKAEQEIKNKKSIIDLTKQKE